MIAILLIGFNRPARTIENLRVADELISEIQQGLVYLSIDGPRKNSPKDDTNQSIFDHSLRSFGASERIRIFRHNNNLGVDSHVPLAISKVLESCEGVLVIEDDINISKSSLLALISMLRVSIEMKSKSPIIGMSGLNMPSFFQPLIRIKWRTSIYFSAWGYALNRFFWLEHQNRLKVQNKISDFRLESKTWRHLSRRQKILWRERITRGNYDYQIQETMFFLGITSIAPTFRMINNNGFEDNVATNTRFSKPLYLRGESSNYKMPRNEFHALTLKNRFFWRLADSNTWAGDGLLTIRGRSIGVRTAVKALLRSLRRNSGFGNQT